MASQAPVWSLATPAPPRAVAPLRCRVSAGAHGHGALPSRPYTCPHLARLQVGHRTHLRGAVVAAAVRRAQPTTPAKLKRGRLAPPGPPDTEDDEDSWRFLSFEPYLRGWEVPWNGGTLALGLFGWAAGFVVTGLLVTPLIAAVEGVSLKELTTVQQTEYVAVVQALETVEGIAIIWLCVRAFNLSGLDLFNVDSSKPLSPPSGWLLWGILFYVAAFPVIGASASVVEFVRQQLLSQPPVPAGNGTVDAILPLIKEDTTTVIALLTVTSILAPLLEEVVFRGFLLTTLTKWMPTPAAVALSSVAFGAAHLSARDFPQLVALGSVLGFSYVRSRNLLTPMLVHGLWNGGVLVVLTILAAQGLDLRTVIDAS